MGVNVENSILPLCSNEAKGDKNGPKGFESGAEEKHSPLLLTAVLFPRGKSQLTSLD